jgi:hypothetical protein
MASAAPARAAVRAVRRTTSSTLATLTLAGATLDACRGADSVEAPRHRAAIKTRRMAAAGGGGPSIGRRLG